MKITVFGASGKVGRIVVKKLVSNGHTVTVFVHRHSPFEPSEHIKIIKSDVHNAAFVEAAVRGADAVICTLGSWGTPTKDILSAAMRFAIPAMQNEGVKRIITLTGSAALLPTETAHGSEKMSRRLFSKIAGDVLRDGETHLSLLCQSGLDWTAIRSPAMRRGTKISYKLTDKAPLPLAFITRTAVAQAIVDQLERQEYIGQAPHIRQA